MSRHGGAFALSAFLVAALAAGPATATPPTRETAHDVIDVDLGDELCGFPLLAHVEQTVTRTTFFDPSGNPTGGLVTGPISITFTNVTTGGSVRLAIPGPTFLDADGNAVRGTGTWVTFTSDGAFIWAAGNIVFDSEGNATEIRGASVSVCDLV
jgi:hypothetical protein